MKTITAQEETAVVAQPAEPDTRHPQLEEIKKAALFLSRFTQSEFEFRYLYDPASMKNITLNPPRDWGTLAEYAKKLVRLNKGHVGIFFGVNANDGQGFRSENIVSACCLFVDLDGTPLDNLQRLKLPPHVIIQTSPGKWHAYWFVDDLPIQQFKALQKRMAVLIGSDPNVCDLARIMRLPGFFHQKDPDKPFLVRIVEMRDDPAFAFADFGAALAAAEQEHGIGKKVASQKAIWETAENDNGREQDDLHESEAAIRHLIQKHALNLGIYLEWVELGMALHHSHGEDGFTLWHDLSSQADGYEGEDACRAKWDTFRDPPERPITMSTYYAKAKKEGWTPTTKAKRGRPKGSKEDKPYAASLTLELVKEAGDEFWLDQGGRTCVSVKCKRPDGVSYLRHMYVGSGDYQNLLCRRYHQHLGNRTLPKDQLNRAINLLDSDQEGLSQHRVYNRFGVHDGAIYLDLGRKDWHCVRIDKDGWDIVTDCPVRFMRGNRIQLPEPQRGGSRSLFKQHFNLPDDDLTKLLGFMIGCFNPIGAYPILMIGGEQGSGKSTMGDNILLLIDPPSEPKHGRLSLCRQEQDLHIHTEKVAVAYFDNLSGLSTEMADALCRLATGAVSSFRVLYSNDGEKQFALSRPIILTSIDTPSNRGDLLSRSLLIEAEVIADRREERVLRAAFDRDRPQMLGFILDCVSAALRHQDEVAQDVADKKFKAPRLADVALFVEGAADLLGIKRGDFCTLLQGEQERIQANSALVNNLGGEIYRYMSTGVTRSVEATSHQLLDLLRGDDRYMDLPAVNRVVPTLKRIMPGLRELGIEVEIGDPQGRAKLCMIKIRRATDFEPFPTVKEDSVF